jgi:anti-anti-sigma factor
MLLRVFKSQEQILEQIKELDREGTKTIEKKSDNIFISSKGSYKIVRVKNEMDSVRAIDEFNRLVNGLIKKGNNKFVFDFKGLSNINSSILGSLASFSQKIQDRDGEICVIADNTEVLVIFDIIGLNNFINIFASEEQFLDKVKKGN